MDTNFTKSREVVVRAIGLVSRVGVGFAVHARAVLEGPVNGEVLGGSMDGFNAGPYLSDRKMMKAVSQTDAIGLVAIENLKKEMTIRDDSAEKLLSGQCGFYVGAPSAFASDNENYLDAVSASADSFNDVSMAKFAREVMSSRPNTLLIGLPNNVLCYGSMLLGIQGPNSNYTSGEMSGVIALAAGVRRLRRAQVDRAVAGAFTAQHERIITKVYDYYGVGNSKKVTTDAGAFVSMELACKSSLNEAAPLATILGLGFGSTGIALNFSEERHSAAECASSDAMLDAIQDAIESALFDAGITIANVGLILAGSTGIPELDQREFLVLSRVLAKGRIYPALGSLSPVMGNMMEAGGLLELVLGGELWRRGEVPAHLRPSQTVHKAEVTNFATVLDKNAERITLILRSSPWGEAAALVVRY